jgi:hypothetical protein
MSFCAQGAAVTFFQKRSNIFRAVSPVGGGIHTAQIADIHGISAMPTPWSGNMCVVVD